MLVYKHVPKIELYPFEKTLLVDYFESDISDKRVKIKIRKHFFYFRRQFENYLLIHVA
jgi:hypothetical protein